MMWAMNGRRRAALAVAARRGEMGMTQDDLARTAGVDVKTIGNLERREMWPHARNRARIEAALGWPAGEMERIAAEDPGVLVPRDAYEAEIAAAPGVSDETKAHLFRVHRLGVPPGPHGTGGSGLRNQA